VSLTFSLEGKRLDYSRAGTKTRVHDWKLQRFPVRKANLSKLLVIAGGAIGAAVPFLSAREQRWQPNRSRGGVAIEAAAAAKLVSADPHPRIELK
jgi:hypothetical protein